MGEKITGRCHCGAVSYAADADPVFSGKCYCEDCRKTGGTGHSAVMAVPKAAFTVDGEVRGYTVTGGSGQPLTRHFCPNCGSKVYGVASVMPDTVLIAASTLDDPSRFESQMSIFVSRAPAWDAPQSGEPQFPEMPPPPDG